MHTYPTIEQELTWARTQMPRLRRALVDLPDLGGVRLAGSIHPDLKMLLALEGILERGAQLFVTTCNPSTVRDEVADRLRVAGATVEAWQGCRATRIIRPSNMRWIGRRPTCARWAPS